ncbi:MAG: hypothetical protein AABX78_03570 [Nanoarchaeota archaeon]
MNEKTIQLIILCVFSFLFIALVILFQSDMGKKFFFAAPSPSLPATPLERTNDLSTFRFYGHISKGQTFQKSVGHGLIFRLNPGDYGWYIRPVP